MGKFGSAEGVFWFDSGPVRPQRSVKAPNSAAGTWILCGSGRPAGEWLRMRDGLITDYPPYSFPDTAQKGTPSEAPVHSLRGAGMPR